MMMTMMMMMMMMICHLVSRSPFLVRLCLLDLRRFQLPTLLHQDDGDDDGGGGDCDDNGNGDDVGNFEHLSHPL